ncbi:hypothetical protein Dimus_009330 [Dionaea muscipula]
MATLMKPKPKLKLLDTRSIIRKEFSLKSFVGSLSRGSEEDDEDDEQIITAAGELGNEIRKGFVPVMVGSERFMIRTRLMMHPSIVALLELSADEFGYEQEGVLQIPCEPEYFRQTINKMLLSKS